MGLLKEQDVFTGHEIRTLQYSRGPSITCFQMCSAALRFIFASLLSPCVDMVLRLDLCLDIPAVELTSVPIADAVSSLTELASLSRFAATAAKSSLLSNVFVKDDEAKLVVRSDWVVSDGRAKSSGRPKKREMKSNSEAALSAKTREMDLNSASGDACCKE